MMYGYKQSFFLLLGQVAHELLRVVFQIDSDAVPSIPAVLPGLGVILDLLQFGVSGGRLPERGGVHVLQVDDVEVH